MSTSSEPREQEMKDPPMSAPFFGSARSATPGLESNQAPPESINRAQKCTLPAASHIPTSANSNGHSGPFGVGTALNNPMAGARSAAEPGSARKNESSVCSELLPEQKRTTGRTFLGALRTLEPGCGASSRQLSSAVPKSRSSRCLLQLETFRITRTCSRMGILMGR